MKVLLTALLTVSLAPKAFANKKPTQAAVDHTRPDMVICKILSASDKEEKAEGKNVSKDKKPSSEKQPVIKVSLERQKGNLYRGANKMLDGKDQYLEVAANVTDHGTKNTIKIAVTETIDGKVTGQAFGDNNGNLAKGYVKVSLSEREALACQLKEIKKSSSGGKPKPIMQK